MINSNPRIHLENLKATPATHPIVDKCIECGFCESHCVSEGLTLSPRQRIVIGREISRLEQTKDNPLLLAQLKKFPITLMILVLQMDYALFRAP